MSETHCGNTSNKLLGQRVEVKGGLTANSGLDGER